MAGPEDGDGVLRRESLLDESLSESFPASDPISPYMGRPEAPLEDAPEPPA